MEYFAKKIKNFFNNSKYVKCRLLIYFKTTTIIEINPYNHKNDLIGQGMFTTILEEGTTLSQVPTPQKKIFTI